MNVLPLIVLLFVGTDETAIKATSSTLPPAELQTADLVLQGMKDSRDRLRSGIFAVHGKKQEVRTSGVPNIDDTAEYFCAFDHDADLFRFDAAEVMVIGNAQYLDREDLPDNFQEPASVEYTPTRVTAKYIRTPKSTFHWHSHLPHRVVVPDSEAEPADLPTVFDIRCLGMTYTYDLERYLRFPKICQFLSEPELIEVTKEGGDIFRLVWAHAAGGSLKRTVWFDRSRGYSPIRMEGRMGDLSTPPVQTSQVAWKEISGVWVPDTFVIEERSLRGKTKRKWILAFDWESVNRPVLEELFTAKALELPRSTELVSMQLGTPVSLGRVGDEPPKPLPEKPVEGSYWSALLIMQIGAAVLLLAAVGMWLIRRYRTARPS